MLEIISYILFTICIFIFLFYSIFWVNPPHYIVAVMMDKVRFIFWYLGLWHSWNMFSTPYHQNKKVNAKIEYVDGTIIEKIIFDPNNCMFMDRLAGHYDIRFMDYFCNDRQNNEIQKKLGDYIDGIFSKQDNKIKQIEFIVESINIPKKGYEYLYNDYPQNETIYIHKV